MKKTKLRELVESWGDKDVSALTPRTIDGIVYCISELAEAAFGPPIIDALWEDIELTQGDFPRNKAIEYLAGEFFRTHLMKALVSVNEDLAVKVKALPELNSDTYVEYFGMIPDLERGVFRTNLHPAGNHISRILAGYGTMSPFQVCDGIVEFFKATNNPVGCMMLIKGLCSKIKNRV